MAARTVPDRRGSARGPAPGTAAAALGLAVLTPVALVVALAALGSAVAGLGRLSTLGTLLAPALGPTLVVAGLVAATGGALLRRRLRRWGTAVAATAALGALGMSVVVAVFTVTTVRAGGSVDLLRAVVPSAAVAAAPDERLVYARAADGQPLHAALYRPPGPARAAPVLVHVHGGGWTQGSELDAAGDLRWFADRGWLVISVEYTLAGAGRPTWDVAGPQIGCALAWVGAHAAALGGDPGRTAVAGDSAGGQLAVTAGYGAAAGTATSSCGGRVPAPRAVAVQYPAVDPAGAFDRGPSEPGPPGVDDREYARAYLGGTPAEVPGRYRSVSGVAAVSPAAPPTLVIGAARDELVPPRELEQFARAATAAGIDTTLVRLPFAGHAYDALAAGSLGNQARLSITLRWLDEHVR